VSGPGSAGLHRVAWDLRAEGSTGGGAGGGGGRGGPLVMPGKYRVTLGEMVDGMRKPLADAQEEEVVQAAGLP
jgi:hypothetical protein